jgi:Protein of unknown function (DUF3014)
MIDTRREPTFSPSRPVEPRKRRRSSSTTAPILVALLAVAAAVAGWFWMTREIPVVETPPTASQPEAEPAAAAPAQPTALVPAPDEALVKAEDVRGALMQLLGRDAVLKFLETTDFPRKAVATLDNLGREHAPVSAWPVLPAPGRFLVAGSGSSQVIATENAMRYWPFVAFVNSIDAAQAVELYRRMYPVLQQAYRDLGFGDRSLHQRVFQVIDVLLATPEPVQPPKITLTEVKGPIPSAQPWTRYQYEDARLERLTAGQKMLLRMGPDNRKALKLKLEEFRQQLLQASAAPSRQ